MRVRVRNPNAYLIFRAAGINTTSNKIPAAPVSPIAATAQRGPMPEASKPATILPAVESI